MNYATMVLGRHHCRDYDLLLVVWCFSQFLISERIDVVIDITYA